MVNQNQGSILLVEDGNELRFVVAAHLKAAGFEVLEARDGAAAIEIANEQQPDVVIMDIGLPVMDGISATRALRDTESTSHIPVIMLTASTRPQDVVRGLEAGAQEYLPKPFDIAELLARVRTVHRLAIARRDLDRLNTQLETEVNIKTKKLRILNEFMRELNEAERQNGILELLVNCVRQVTGATRVSVLLRDVDGINLVCRYAIGMDSDSVKPIPLENVEGITGQVFKSGKTLSARLYGGADPQRRNYQTDSFVSTPLFLASLVTPDGMIGVLNVTEKPDNHLFSEDEVQCIRSVADAAAIALDNITRRNSLQESVRVLLQTVGHLAEYRDEETTLHLERVTKMARILARSLKSQGPYAGEVTEKFVDMLVQAAPMHDIGKVGIPDEILTKPGSLTDEEFQIMKTHTDIGRRVLSRAVDHSCPNPLLQMCIDIAHCHHERYNGRGYPRRLSGKDIPLSARIIALVDAYDAITSKRRYKAARSHIEAIEVIREEAGEHFDPVLVEAFLRSADKFNEVRENLDESSQAKPALTKQ